MKLSIVLNLVFLIVGAVNQIMAIEDDICHFEKGDYKTVRLADGRISLFKNDKFYTFREGDIRNAEINTIADIYPHTLEPIDECFMTNGKIYYLRGDNAVVYKSDNNPSVIDWRQLETSIDHVIIKEKGLEIGFFVPPKTSNNGNSRSSSRSNNIEIISYGGGSVSTSSVNGNYKIQYNGWNIPIDFNAYIVNEDNSLTFFNDDKYCVVRKTIRRRNYDFEWRDVSTLFGC